MLSQFMKKKNATHQRLLLSHVGIIELPFLQTSTNGGLDSIELLENELCSEGRHVFGGRQMC